MQKWSMAARVRPAAEVAEGRKGSTRPEYAEVLSRGCFSFRVEVTDEAATVVGVTAEVRLAANKACRSLGGGSCCHGSSKFS